MNEERHQNLSFESPTLAPYASQVLKDNILFPVSAVLPGATAATAANHGVFFVADKAYKVISIAERHRTATDATLQVEKLEAGEAKGNGDDLLTTAFNLNATADTNQYGALTTSNGHRIMKKGDALGLVNSGTITSLADLAVTVILKQA